MSQTKEDSVIPGGLSKTEKAGPVEQDLVDKVKVDVEKAASRNFDCYEAVQYRRQVVAGLMYYIKVHVGGEKYIEVKELETPGPDVRVEYIDFLDNRTKDDEVVPF